MDKIVLFLILFLLANGCATLNREKSIALKSYELGCIDHGSGSPAENFTCHKYAERFEKELEVVWRKGN